MKVIEKVSLLILVLGVLLCVCACGGAEDDSALGASGSEPVQELPSHTVTVVDDDNNPVSGVMLQLCLDSCFPAKTNEDGVAEFYSLQPGEYKITVLAMPEGYDYATDVQEWCLPEGENHFTITLQRTS